MENFGATWSSMLLLSGFLLAWGGSVTTTMRLSVLPQPIGVGYHSVESVGSAKLPPQRENNDHVKSTGISG
jgi:hypothetical protein